MKKIVFYMIAFVSTFCLNSFAADDAKTQVIALIEKLKESTENGSTNLAPVIEERFDFSEISDKALLGVKKLLIAEIGRDKTKELVQAKKSNFEKNFKEYVIKKYATSESINKFKTLLLDDSKTKVQPKSKVKHNVKVVLKDPATGAEWNASFDVTTKTNKIIEITFEGNFSLFLFERDEITARYKKQTAGTPEEKLQAVIDQLT